MAQKQNILKFEFNISPSALPNPHFENHQNSFLLFLNNYYKTVVHPEDKIVIVNNIKGTIMNMYCHISDTEQKTHPIIIQ